ncbi:heme-degrading domain-containing protein [Rhizobium sp. SAFR-030]|uniref:heme-degrading domain-containing protein n=1 Tax=Rhizobium sp. SAFR-030 TaxID=3387277 RepID=UPI003F7DFC5A
MLPKEPTLAELADELKSLEIDRFDHEFAWNLGMQIRDKANKGRHDVAIEIRHGSDVIFATLVGQATIDNFDWARRKCAVVHRFHRSSLAMRLEAEQNGYDFNTRFRLPPADFAASGGGVPLVLKGGTFIGSVGVSGLPNVEDHRLISETLRLQSS